MLDFKLAWQTNEQTDGWTTLTLESLHDWKYKKFWKSIGFQENGRKPSDLFLFGLWTLENINYVSILLELDT